MLPTKMFVAALLVCWGVGSTCMADDTPGTGSTGSGGAGAVCDKAAIVTSATSGSAKEQTERIERALKDLVDLQFVDTPLSDVVDYCSNRLEINILIDGKGLTDAAVDPSAPVTFATHKPITFESALRLILREFDLAFVVQDEVLSITSRERANSVLTTKIYYVGDLVVVGGSKRPNYGPLMNLITSTIQPNTWDDNGGPGSIQPFLATGSLVFSQKQDVHIEVAELLTKLRQQQKEHGAPANARKDELFLKTYNVGTISGEQAADAIRKLIAPSTWQGKGGEGEICVVSQRLSKPGQTETLSSDMLFVRQTGEVHDAIADLLTGMRPSRTGGMTAFGGWGGGGGMILVPGQQ
ncbi:MAG TPA: hypothetical protein VHD36_13200 [Pirellulales bacterium]|nr:hypothetical protein [Pirellulales bacterium]